jgi:alpha-tubulin suppressor-like RCC1 family protein
MLDFSFHGIAVKTDGTLWTWGSGAYGTLGSGSTVNRSSPQTTTLAGTDWTKVSAGDRFSAAIKSDGVMYTWGRNNRGQLGSGTTTNRSSPVSIFGTVINNWTQIACGYEHALGIAATGLLYSWGSGAQGALGSDSTASRSSPVTVAGGGTNWIVISAGTSFSAGLKSDGTMWTWGLNTSGQLGDNSTTARSSPQTVAGAGSGGTNWKAVSLGDTHAAAIKTDGTLWTWGLNTSGQLGDGSTTNRSSPQTTAGAGLNWVRTHSGWDASSGIKADGTLWTWGLNTSGELGIGTTTNRSSPGTVVPNYTNWKFVAMGKNSTGAIKEEDDW